eukprot:227650-Chlamydomonas_euryale.AAC.1
MHRQPENPPSCPLPIHMAAGWMHVSRATPSRDHMTALLPLAMKGLQPTAMSCFQGPHDSSPAPGSEGVAAHSHVLLPGRRGQQPTATFCLLASNLTALSIRSRGPVATGCRSPQAVHVHTLGPSGDWLPQPTSGTRPYA